MKIQSSRKYKASSAPVKVEEPKVIPEVEVEEETIEDPDDGEGEG